MLLNLGNNYFFHSLNSTERHFFYALRVLDFLSIVIVRALLWITWCQWSICCGWTLLEHRFWSNISFQEEFLLLKFAVSSCFYRPHVDQHVLAAPVVDICIIFFRRQTHSLDLTTCVAWSVYLSSTAEANWLAEFDKLHSFVFTGRLFERIRVILPKSTSRYITSTYVPCGAEGGGSGSASSNLSYLHGLGCFRFADRSCLRYKKGLCKSITGAVYHVCMATFNSHFH